MTGRMFWFAVEKTLKVSWDDIRRSAGDVWNDVSQSPELRYGTAALIALIVFLLVCDFVVSLFTFLDVTPLRALWQADILRVDSDGSLSEYVEYALLLFGSGAMQVSWVYRGSPVFLTLAVCNLIFFADNSLRLHEQLGAAINASAGFATYDWGEVLLFSGLGTVLAVGLCLSIRASDRAARAWGALCLASLAGAGFCATFGDLLHSGYDAPSVLGYILTVFEDAAELVFISLEAVLCAAMLYRVRRQP